MGPNPCSLLTGINCHICQLLCVLQPKCTRVFTYNYFLLHSITVGWLVSYLCNTWLDFMLCEVLKSWNKSVDTLVLPFPVFVTAKDVKDAETYHLHSYLPLTSSLWALEHVFQTVAVSVEWNQFSACLIEALYFLLVVYQTFTKKWSFSLHVFFSF